MSIVIEQIFCPVASARSLVAAIERVLAEGAEGLLVLACAEDAWSPVEYNPVLKSISVPVFGALFPGVVYRGECYRSGILVIGLAGRPTIKVVSKLSDRAQLEKQLDSLQNTLVNAAGLLLLVDGMAPNIEPLVKCVFRRVSSRQNIAGAGAGSLNFGDRPCLLSNHGLLADAAIILALDQPLFSASSHGWQKLEGPYLVTGARANVLDYINYQPAFEFYRELLMAHSDEVLGVENFFKTASRYPLGIADVDGEVLVRAPLKLVDDSIVCAGEVPINTSVYLLHTDKPALQASCVKAGELALQRLHESRGRAGKFSALLFDCVGLSLFQGADFPMSLQALKKSLGECSIIGALSFGEISALDHGPIAWMNKTTVVALL